MPDWITHLGIVWIICTLSNIKNKYIALIGAIIPDLAKLALIAFLITLMWHWGDAGIAFLLPITNEEYGFNLIWPDDLRPMLLTIIGVS